MMNRQFLYLNSHTAAAESVFILQMALDGEMPLEAYRPRLQRVVGKLRFASKLLLACGAAPDHPDLYGPLADALISVREALQSTFIDRDGLLCAAAYLEHIIVLTPRKGGRNHVA